MHNITSFGCVTKSWRSPSRQCTNSLELPQLVEIQGKNRGENQSYARAHKIDIPFHNGIRYRYFKRRSYELFVPRIYFKGHSHGQIIVMGANLYICCLWEPGKDLVRYLPIWDPNTAIRLGTLTSHPDDPNGCIIMALEGHNFYPTFGFCWWVDGCSDWSWTMKKWDIKEPHDPTQTMQFTNAIGFKGKFYALSLQGSVVVIVEVDSCFGITRVGKNRAVPCKLSRQFREYLMESDGEILLVFLISKKSIHDVEDVEVYRLDIEKVLWVKVEGLGERALFECCMWVDASKVGCMKNCVYFTHHRVDKWLIFDMESGHISPTFGSESENQESVVWGEMMEWNNF